MTVRAALGTSTHGVDLLVLRAGQQRLAWWFWLAAHVFFLIGFRNRIVVLLNWAVAYWSYQRSARIIFGDDQEDRPPR